MRLIDADAVMRLIPMEEPVARMTIANAPTSNVRPNVKGEWIPNKFESWECSVCHKENFYAFRYNDYLTDRILQDFFCPNCGADMRGEQDNVSR